MSETNGKGIHVVGVHVERLHRLRLANVELLPGGGVVRVTGKNGAGKSSLLRAIREAIGGAGEVAPVAVNEGSEDGAGSVRLTLSNGFTVTRSFTEAAPKGYLKVVGPDGGVHKQSRLTEWLGRHHDFDVLAFFDLPANRQREILLGLGSDPDLASKLDDVRGEYRELYEQRTPHISEQQRCRRVKAPEGERPTPIDVSAESKRLAELQAMEREHGDAARDAVRLGGEEARALKAVEDGMAEVVRLELALAQAREALLEREAEAKAVIEAHESAQAAFEAMVDPEEEMAAVLARMDAANEINAALEPWREYERAQESLAKATTEADALTVKLDECRAEERRLIASGGIPVEGLTFDPETAEPMLNGRPLAVAGGAERIRMAVAVAVAEDPELRICLVDEANDLDLDALKELGRLAVEHDFQVWACRIGLESPGEIIVEDGVARTRGAEQGTA